MIRVVLDTGVYVSGVIARGGPPDQILRAWRRNAIEVIASPMLLDELQRVLARPKFAAYVTISEAQEFVERVRRRATVLDDPAAARPVTRDPDDEYLVALAEHAEAVLVSGDRDLLEAHVASLEIITPRQLATRLDL